MNISEHIEEMMRDLDSLNLSETTKNGMKSIIAKTSKEEWHCMEDFLGNVFAGLQQNLYNLETYAIENDDDEFDSVNRSIATAICSLLAVKNYFSEAKKND